MDTAPPELELSQLPDVPGGSTIMSQYEVLAWKVNGEFAAAVVSPLVPS